MSKIQTVIAEPIDVTEAPSPCSPAPQTGKVGSAPESKDLGPFCFPKAVATMEKTMSKSLRRSCISAAWDARKVARRMARMGQETNARHAKSIMRAYLNEARRLRGIA